MKMPGGSNRTGAALAPHHIDAMLEAGREFPPNSRGDESEIARVRVRYAKGGEPIGTMPPPPGVKELAKTAAKAVLGKQPLLFLDKLGERLAFERSGVRLYQALVSKREAYGGFSGGPSRTDLEHLLAEEREHFHMLAAVVEQLGGDPTAVTPSADVHATLSKGIVAVLTDPRTSLVQSLEGILLAELADNECWTALVALAREAGDDDLTTKFEDAEGTEREHLTRVRTWIAAAQSRTAAGGVPFPQAIASEMRSRSQRSSADGSRASGRRTARARAGGRGRGKRKTRRVR